MPNIKRITAPLTKEMAKTLSAGDEVLLSGTIYTARDAAHKRLCQLIENGEKLPIELENAVIYYVGPTPTKPNAVIGSAGPTTSYRMDAYSPALIKLGHTGMIGKGERGQPVIDAMQKHTAVYFASIGGAAVLVAKSIVACETVCYADLGSEAIRRLQVVDMPLTVVIDCNGNNLYTIGRQSYLASLK